jgi:alpha-L-fucosidase
MNYVTTQLTELLTNYGPIPILIIDGWSWRMGHNAVAYEKIRALVKSLQPDCLVTDHTHLNDPWEVDITNFEEPAGSFVPANNTYAGNQEQKINSSGGNDWFWAPNIGGLMTVDNIVNGHLKMLEPRWTNFLLNCPPNRTGTLDAAIVTRLGEVGAMWSPNTSRPTLPAQGAQIEYPYTAASATATSGTAASAIDGINDYNRNTIWRRPARCRSRSRSISAPASPTSDARLRAEYARTWRRPTARSRRTASSPAPTARRSRGDVGDVGRDGR